MPQAKSLIEKIEARMGELRAALPPEARKAFEERYYALTDALAAGGDPEQVGQDLHALLLDFPAAAALLGVAPAEAPVEPPAAVTPAPPKADAAVDEAARPPALIPDARRGFTVESFIQILKEVVAAAIAIALVWTTMRLAANMLDYVGDETRMSQAKDLLTVMTGLLGVVMGYYFGRIPAEARAAQAQEQAAQAVQKGEQAAAHSEMVSARAEELAGQASQLAAQMQGGAGVRGQPNASEALQRWAGEVEALRRMARSR